MQFTMTSLLSGVTRTRDIPCTQAQYDAWKAGTHIQDAMPDVSPEDREFLISGTTQEEWDESFGEDE